MKKIILTTLLLASVFVCFSQLRPVEGGYTIDDATTALGQNVPIGTRILNLATGEIFVANTGVLSTATLTTGAASFDKEGTVTSVGGTGTVNGLTLSGTVTSTGNLTLGGTLAINNGDWSGTDLSVANGGTGASTLTGIVIGNGTSAFTTITDNSSNWNTAYSDRLKWDGGATGLVAATGRTSLGATTVGSNLFTLTNPSAITFLRINADNSVSALSAADFRTAIGVGTGTGTVESVAISGTDGLEVDSGSPITTSGTITLGVNKTTMLSTLNVEDGAEVNNIYFTESFTEDDGTPTVHSLSHTATGSATVSVNGSVLDPAYYTFTTTTVTLLITVYQYDKVTVSYNY